MIKIEYSLTSYEDFFRHISKCLGLKRIENIISFTDDKGSGSIKFISLLNGLQVLIFNFTSFDKLLFHLKKTSKEFFVLRLDEAINEDGSIRSSVFFAKTNQEWFYLASENTHLQSINILMSKQWMEDYLENEAGGEILNSYITLTSPLLIYKIMDVEYMRLMHEIINLAPEKQFEHLIIYNRVCLILERFYTKLLKSIENQNGALRISAAEFRRIKNVENELLKDFSQPPPAIAQLARTATMSPSKLKILFKKAFGQPINQYYQRHRMNRAKAMLLSKKYPVREIADTLGFSNVSSFNKAFYKAFDQLPAEVFVPAETSIPANSID